MNKRHNYPNINPKLPFQITGVCVTGTWLSILIITLLKFKTIDYPVTLRILVYCFLTLVIVGPIAWIIGKIFLKSRMKSISGKSSSHDDLLLGSSLINEIPTSDEESLNSMSREHNIPD